MGDFDKAEKLGYTFSQISTKTKAEENKKEKEAAYKKLQDDFEPETASLEQRAELKAGYAALYQALTPKEKADVDALTMELSGLLEKQKPEDEFKAEAEGAVNKFADYIQESWDMAQSEMDKWVKLFKELIASISTSLFSSDSAGPNQGNMKQTLTKMKGEGIEGIEENRNEPSA